MTQWRLPRDDIGWCFTTAGWGALGALKTAQRRGEQGHTSVATPDLSVQPDLSRTALPDLAVMNPDRVKVALAPVLGLIEEPLHTGLLPALGRWIADLVETSWSAAVPVTVALWWNPRLELRIAAQARMLVEAERAIKEQLAAADAWFTDAGATRTETKTSGLEHFRWLVQYQMNEELSHKDIAADFKAKSSRAVRAAIRETAQLICLPRRSPKPGGRPRKTPDDGPARETG